MFICKRCCKKSTNHNNSKIHPINISSNIHDNPVKKTPRDDKKKSDHLKEVNFNNDSSIIKKNVEFTQNNQIKDSNQHSEKNQNQNVDDSILQPFYIDEDTNNHKKNENQSNLQHNQKVKTPTSKILNTQKLFIKKEQENENNHIMNSARSEKSNNRILHSKKFKSKKINANQKLTKPCEGQGLDDCQKKSLDVYSNLSIDSQRNVSDINIFVNEITSRHEHNFVESDNSQISHNLNFIQNYGIKFPNNEDQTNYLKAVAEAKLFPKVYDSNHDFSVEKKVMSKKDNYSLSNSQLERELECSIPTKKLEDYNVAAMNNSLLQSSNILPQANGVIENNFFASEKNCFNQNKRPKKKNGVTTSEFEHPQTSPRQRIKRLAEDNSCKNIISVDFDENHNINIKKNSDFLSSETCRLENKTITSSIMEKKINKIQQMCEDGKTEYETKKSEYNKDNRLCTISETKAYNGAKSIDDNSFFKERKIGIDPENEYKVNFEKTSHSSKSIDLICEWITREEKSFSVKSIKNHYESLISLRKDTCDSILIEKQGVISKDTYQYISSYKHKFELCQQILGNMLKDDSNFYCKVEESCSKINNYDINCTKTKMINEVTLGEELMPIITEFKQGQCRNPFNVFMKIKPILENAEYWREY